MHRVQNSLPSAALRLQLPLETALATSPVDARPTPALEPTAAQPTYSRTVHHGGNRYFATAGMAEIFRAKAQQIVTAGETELVPLLHSTGVDLLLIGPQTRFTVVTIEIGHHTAA